MPKPDCTFVFIDAVGTSLAPLGVSVRRANDEREASIHGVARSGTTLFDQRDIEDALVSSMRTSGRA